MNKKIIFIVILLIAAIILGFFILVVYMNSSSNIQTTLKVAPAIITQQPIPTIRLASTSTVKSFMTDMNGKSLYFFTKDTPQKSNCTGNCLNLWIPFYSQNIIAPNGLRSSDFGQIVNSAKINQTTYLGKPLYYYSLDKKAGDTKGNKLNKVWFLAVP